MGLFGTSQKKTRSLDRRSSCNLLGGTRAFSGRSQVSVLPLPRERRSKSPRAQKPNVMIRLFWALPGDTLDFFRLREIRRICFFFWWSGFNFAELFCASAAVVLHLICFHPFGWACSFFALECLGVGVFFFFCKCALMFGWWCPARLKGNPTATPEEQTLSSTLCFGFQVLLEGLEARIPVWGTGTSQEGHKKPKRGISCHCTSQLVGLHVLLLHAGSVLHFCLWSM